MSRARMVPVMKEEIDSILQALEMNRTEGAVLVGVSPNALSHWARQREMPAFRLEILAGVLAKKLRSKQELTEIETRAVQTIERALKMPLNEIEVILIEGISWPVKGKLSSILKRKSHSESELPELSSNTTADLNGATVEQLVDQLESRGFSVSLTWRNKS